MSGICGLWRKQNPERTPETLALIHEGLSVAGAERAHRETSQGAGVGVCSRFDGQQIYQNARVLVACDTDLYNQDDARDGARAGEDTPARTAALLAALYERHGAGFVEKLRGAFSVILWDRRERKLVAAIDGFGIKRLAYFEDGNVAMIASRVDALARCGEIDLGINPRAIPNVLNFSVNLAPETIFTKIQRLEPGSVLVISDGQRRMEKYWDMRYGLAGATSERRMARELESVVENSVAMQSKDQPPGELGAFLSGGTDSSTVLGMMARTVEGPVKAFSIGFQEQPFNELGYARIAAQKFRADHHTYLVGPDDCFQALPHMIRCFDEPFGNSSAIPTYFCAKLAAGAGVKTLLAGDGGDELFGGNERYLTDKIFAMYHDIPGVFRRGVIEPVLGILPVKGGLVGSGRGYVRRANLPAIERFLSFQFLRTHAPADIFHGDFLKALGGYTILDIPGRHYEQASARDHLDRLLYVDVKITLGDNDLPKVTCMSELAGIQTRFPFLERSVAEFSGRIPPNWKVKRFQKRYLFKRAFGELLPAEIIQKKKHGFGIPVAAWLKSDPRMRELARDTLLSARAFERGYFRREFIEDLFRRNEADDSTYYGDTLWTVLALELWHRQVVDEPARIPA